MYINMQGTKSDNKILLSTLDYSFLKWYKNIICVDINENTLVILKRYSIPFVFHIVYLKNAICITKPFTSFIIDCSSCADQTFLLFSNVKHTDESNFFSSSYDFTHLCTKSAVLKTFYYIVLRMCEHKSICIVR